MILLTVGCYVGSIERIYCKDKAEMKEHIDIARGQGRKVLGVREIPPVVETEPTCTQLELFDK